MDFWTIFWAVILAVVVLAFSPYILIAICVVVRVVWWLLFGWWINWMRKIGL